MREAQFAAIADSFETIDDTIDEHLEQPINFQSLDGMEAHHEILGVEADVNEVGMWLGNYLRTPNSEYQARMFNVVRDTQEHLARLINLRLTKEHQYWAGGTEKSIRPGGNPGWGDRRH